MQGVEVAVARPRSHRQPQVGRLGDRPQQHRALGERRDDVGRLVAGELEGDQAGRASRRIDGGEAGGGEPGPGRRDPLGGQREPRRPSALEAVHPRDRRRQAGQRGEVERPGIEAGGAGAHVPDDAVGVGQVARERRPQAVVVTRVDPERSRPVRAEQPLLAGDRVEVGPGLLHRAGRVGRPTARRRRGAARPHACAASAISGSGRMRPVVQRTCEIATIRVVGPIEPMSSSAATKRMTAPRRTRSSSSGPSTPGCSSVVVRISSPAVPLEARRHEPDALARRGRHGHLVGRRPEPATRPPPAPGHAPPRTARRPALRSAAG